jgi:hypothetical protein
MFSVGNSNPPFRVNQNLNNPQNVFSAGLNQGHNSQSTTGIAQDLQTKLDFTNLLVASIIGLGLNDIKPEKRPELIEKCFQIYTDFVYSYIEHKYGKQEFFRIKGHASYDTDLSLKFPQISQYLNEATLAFLQTLEQGVKTKTSV